MKKIIALSILFSGSCLAQMGWTKITSTTNPIITTSGSGAYKGAAWVDVDNDGRIDLFTSNKFLYRNLGADSFAVFPTIIGQAAAQAAGGSSWADLDNDGDIDCVHANYPSGVYLNNGAGTFSNVTSSVDSLNNYAAWGCAIGNWNNDPYLDFVYAHAAGFHPGSPKPGRLYKQSVSGFMPVVKLGYTFTDSLKPFTVPYWSDYDMDGDMDLFIASGPGGSPGPDFCYKNLKMETSVDTLVRMTTELFTQQMQDGQCYNFVDYDNDGDFDLCLTNYGGAQTRLYKNTLGTYTTVTSVFTGTAVNNLSNNWGDFDNDGDQDLILTADIIPTRYYQNNGNGTFTFLASSINSPAGGAGVSNGDYDNDGDLDVYIHGNNAGKALYKNDTVAGNRKWVNIKLTGNPSNKSAIGAIVKLKATIYGNPIKQIREVNAQNSFQSQNDLRVHFGLGNASVIDSIIIRWPSANTQTFTNVVPGKFYSIIEGGTLTQITGIKNGNTVENEVFKVYPNPTNSFLNIEYPSEIKVSYIEIRDLQGKQLKKYDSGTKSIDVSKLKSGMYFIILVSPNSKELTQRVVIE